MNLIQEFYKNLDALELIIFWGIILVIIFALNSWEKCSQVNIDNMLQIC